MERQYSKAILLLGLVLIILAGYRSGTVLYNYVWNYIAGGVGIFLIIVALGDLVASEQLNKRATTLHFLGYALAGAGPVLLMFTQLAIIVNLPSWWVLPLVGVAFLLCGVTLILWSRSSKNKRPIL